MKGIFTVSTKAKKITCILTLITVVALLHLGIKFSIGGLLRVSLTARRSNKSILKESNPEYSLEGLMLKLKLHYFGHLMQRADSLEKTLLMGKIEGRRRRG